MWIWFLVVAVICLGGGAYLGYRYGAKVVADYEKAASDVGVVFQKIDNKVKAIKKG